MLVYDVDSNNEGFIDDFMYAIENSTRRIVFSFHKKTAPSQSLNNISLLLYMILISIKKDLQMILRMHWKNNIIVAVSFHQKTSPSQFLNNLELLILYDVDFNCKGFTDDLCMPWKSLHFQHQNCLY